jgi:large subunit ribosomal protein L24
MPRVFVRATPSIVIWQRQGQAGQGRSHPRGGRQGHRRGDEHVKRHTRPNPLNQEGGIVEREAPLFASKVMPVDPETGKGTRGRKVKVVEKGARRPASP